MGQQVGPANGVDGVGVDTDLARFGHYQLRRQCVISVHYLCEARTTCFLGPAAEVVPVVDQAECVL